MKDCAEPVDEIGEKVIFGVSLTSLTRTREPLEGCLEEKEMVSSCVGVKVGGMMAEGSREADLSESMSAIVISWCRRWRSFGRNNVRIHGAQVPKTFGLFCCVYLFVCC